MRIGDSGARDGGGEEVPVVVELDVVLGVPNVRQVVGRVVVDDRLRQLPIRQRRHVLIATERQRRRGIHIAPIILHTKKDQTMRKNTGS